MRDVFEEAKQKFELPALLERYGFEIRRVGSSLRSNRCPACGASKHRNSTRLSIIQNSEGAWLWHCFACGKSGDVVTAVQYLEGFYSALDAARWLLEDFKPEQTRPKGKLSVVKTAPPDPDEISEKNKARLEVIKKLLSLALTAKGSRKRCWGYFIEERKIPELVLREALRRKIVHLLPDSPVALNNCVVANVELELLKKAKLIKGRKLRNTILLRPIVSPFLSKKKLTGAQFRAIDPDVQLKAVSLVSNGLWWWSGEQKGSVAVVEGVIDMLSLVAMQWNGCILGMAGCGLARRAAEVIKGSLRGRVIYLGLDGDKAGREAAEIISGASQFCQILTLSGGKDLNDLLREGVRDWRELITEEREVLSC